MVRVKAEDGQGTANIVEADKSYKDFTVHLISNVLLREEVE